jgi:acetaldehyde dehydrogenase (acetylating)
LIQCLGNPTLEATNELMRHKRTAVILSTGGSGIVKAAYSSGKPAFGVGPGNVPVVVDKSADIAEAVAKVVSGKSFDYGTLCSSEQTLIFEEVLREQIFAELRKRKAFLCDAAQAQALTKVLLTAPNWAVNPACVGQSPGRIAEMAGFRVPDDTSILAAEIGGVGKEHPLSAEKLSPVLSLLAVRDFAAALDGAEAVLQFGGLGHTCAIYARDEARIRQFALRMPAMRVLCNTPTPQGSVGITTGLFPAMTLGCGAVAGNITGDNVSPLHLINTKRLAYAVRKAEDAFEAHVSDERHDGNPVPDRQAIAAAVERYMASKQVSVRTGQGGTTVAGVVDRFLAARRGDTRKSNAPPTRGAIERAFENQIEKSVEKAVPKPEAVPLTVVDFVCENDVRAAILKSQKIYIGPKTIVTPSARDLAGQYDILVLAKRT